MHQIDVKLLQQPSVYLDGVHLIFPYKKAEALFLYLVVEKNTSRDAVSTLLWEDASEETAKKNLRNALYICRKLFGFDVIESPQKSNLSLVPDIAIHSDYDDYLSTGDFSLYHEFMQNFMVKNANAYEEWMELKRESMRNDYLTRLYSHLVSLPFSMLSEVELCCNKYMEFDPFDERVTLYLMKAYQANGLFLKGIKAYQKLHRELSAELAITPGPETTALYHRLRSSWAEISAASQTEDLAPIPGRSAEYSALNAQYHIFRNGKSTAVLLKGENGSGKTFLLRTFMESIQDDDVLVLSNFSMNARHQVPLSAWNPVILQLDDFIKKQQIRLSQTFVESIAYFFPTFGDTHINGVPSIDIANDFSYRAAQNALIRIFMQVTRDYPVLVIFDNLHNADSFSQQLAYTVSMNLPQNFMLVFSAPEMIPSGMRETLVHPLEKGDLLQEIDLKPLSREDCADIIIHQSKLKYISADLVDRIYEQTSGNTFFLIEALKVLEKDGSCQNLTLSAQNIISERLAGLSVKSRQLLDILSLFENCCELDILENILDASSLEMLDDIEELKSKSLIRERVENSQIVFSFQHEPIKEYVCASLAPSKKKLLHNVIGYAIEKTMTEHSAAVYEALIYHFTEAKNHVKALTYRIFSLEDSSVLQLELYPSNKNALLADAVDVDSYQSVFLQLENDLDGIRHQFSNDTEYQMLITSLLLTKGRFFILQGNYYNGVSAIKSVLKNPYCLTHTESLLAAYRQMIYYGIQIYQTDIMEEYITKGIQKAHEENISFEYAIFLRLQGLMHLMDLRFEDALLPLQHSIDILQNYQFTSRLALMNIAAAYNYIGEVMRRQQKYDSAISHYQRAISLCEQHGLTTCAYVFSNLGLALFENQDREKAQETFLMARRFYENTQTLMGRSTCFGFCSLFLYETGESKEADRMLELACQAAEQLASPYEKGILCAIEASVASRFPESASVLFLKAADEYDKESRQLFSSIRLEAEYAHLFRLLAI